MADHVVRALTDDGAFRVVVVEATSSAQGVAQAQNATGARAKLLAEMVTGTILVRETMAPDLRVQGILQGHDQKSRIVADSFPDGSARGLVQLPPESEIALGDRALLQMMRTLRNGELAQGVVSADTGSGISGALMQYMQASEQVASFVAVGALVEGGVTAAGGYLVQLLPEAGEGPLMVMTERLRDFESIDSLLARGAADPSSLLEELLYLMPHTQVGKSALRYECKCSEERLTASLATLPKQDIKELVQDGLPLEIDCDYCGRHYRFSPERLRGMLAAS
jgi:molecular chaperone Hsp33